MREVRKLEKNQLKDALSIAAKAYPMMGLTSELKLQEFETRILEDFNQESGTWYGLFEDSILLGCMILYDFVINYYGHEIKAKGIGAVAVEFLHKKQKVCKELLHWYLEYSLKQKYPLAMLYAFKPEFYYKMGFGYGTTCYNYVTKPNLIPKSNENYKMDYLNQSDVDDILAFYHEIYQGIHGMTPRKEKNIAALLKTPGLYFVCYREQEKLTALLVFRLISNDSTNNETDMELDLLFTTPIGLKAAMNFLNSQSDQVRQISISTLYKDFFYNFADIRHIDHKVLKQPGYHHTYDAGMGIMYRSLNSIELITKRPSTLDNIKIRFILNDSFVEDCPKDFVMEWKAGKASLSKSKKYDLELKFDVSDFSSWILNAIDITTLYQYGLVEISDKKYIPFLEQAFYYQQKPTCLERF